MSTIRRSSWGARLVLLLASAIFLLPLYWMVITSLKSPAELAQAHTGWLPTHWHWASYRDALQSFPFGRYFLNSLIITALSVFGSALINLVIAYGFACLDWPGRDRVFLIVIATMFLPAATTIIPTFDLFSWLHWVDGWLPLIVPHFLGSGFFVFLLRQFLLQIPRDLLDAARVDGMNDWRILQRVAAPMARPALAVVAIFTAIGAWNDFLGPLIYIQNPHLQPLAVGLQSLRQTQPDKITTNLLMAAATMVIVPIIVLFFVFQRFFVRGITLGSIR